MDSNLAKILKPSPAPAPEIKAAPPPAS
jgi:hypothetical protein